MTRSDKPADIWPDGVDPLLDRSWSNAVYWFVLATAAAVDVVNFQGVVAIVMRDSAEFLTWTVVAGFTVLALALSHQVGVQARDRVDRGRHSFNSAVGCLAFAGWLAMGLFAFVVRLDDPRHAGALGELRQGGPPMLAAGLFLIFYLVTGLVAGLAGYRRPTIDVSRRRRAANIRLRLSDDLVEAQGRVAEVTARLAAFERRRARRQEELRLELASPHVEELAVVRAYHEDLARLDEQELTLSSELARLERAARRLAGRLRETAHPSEPHELSDGTARSSPFLPDQ